MTKSKQSLSKKVNLNDFSNAISPLGAVLTFAFCLLFFMFVLQPTTYNTRFTFELTKQLSMGSFQAYQFSCSEYETILSVVAGIVIGMCQFEFLHRKAYLTTILSFGVKREKLFKHRLLIPLVTSVVVILITELIALGLNIKVIDFQPELPLIFLDNMFCIFKYFLYTYTVTVVACVFTGRTIEAILSALSLTVFGYVVIFFIEAVLPFALYGRPDKNFLMDGHILMALNPLANLWSEINDLGNQYTFNEKHIASLISSIIWCVACLVIFVFLTKFFKMKYKSEKAGFKGIYKPLLISVISTLSIGIAFAVTYIADQSYIKIYDKKVIVLTLLIILIGILLITPALYLIVYKNAKKLKTAFVGAGISIAFIVAMFTVCLTGIFGTYNIPPEANDIESIAISSPFAAFAPVGHNSYFTNPFNNYSEYSFVFKDKEDIDLIRETHQLLSVDEEEKYPSDFMIKYTLKNGETIERKFNHINREALDKILPIWDSDEIKNYYLKLFFPDYDLADESFASWMLLNELGPVCDYNSDYIQLFFVSKHNVKTEILNSDKKDGFTESQYIQLKNAIYKDFCEISYEEYFTPSTEYYGTLYFSRYNHTYSRYLKVHVTADMKNTVAFLEGLEFYDTLISKQEIQRMITVDIKEFTENLYADHIAYKYHEPYLECDDEIYYEAVFNIIETKEITKKEEIQKTFNKVYSNYLLYNSGKLVFVEFEDGSRMTYGLPE